MESNEEVQIEDISGSLCVFYSDSPFSDFAVYSFVVDGIWYASVEHYFETQMLQSFGLFKLASQLSSLVDTNIFRRTLRKNLLSLTRSGLFDDRMFAAWRKTNASRLMKIANRAKFEQNFDLKKYLLETGDRILVFTSKNDRLLGVGMDELTFLDWVREQRWTVEDLLNNFSGRDANEDGIVGKNMLGVCLMEIRASLSRRPSILTVWKQRFGNESEEASSRFDAAITEGETSDMVDASTVSSEQSGDSVTDVQILSNLINAETGVRNEIEAEGDGRPRASPPAASIFLVPNEKRIVYKRPGYVPRVVGGDAWEQHSASKSTAECADSDRNDKKNSVLERLKALRFEKPMINPFAMTTPANCANAEVRMSSEALKNSTNESARAAKRRKVRRCDIPMKRTPCNSRYILSYPQLEPGEVPPPDYGPTLVPADYNSAYFGSCPRGDPALSHCPDQSLPPQHLARSDPSASAWPDQSHVPAPCHSSPPATPGDKQHDEEMWIPSSNPMKDIFESAKAGIQKLIDTSKHGQGTNADVSHLLLLRPPPIQSQPDARKRKCSSKRKSAPMFAGITFNSKDAQMRHVSNRWVKGGRLTTTGKFEEATSDEEQLDDSVEVARTLRQLEATVDVGGNDHPTRPVQLHVVYEDTNDYADYVKWYANIHGCAPSDRVDNEYEQYLRQWYRYYRTAVKFVDVDPLSDDEEDTEGETALSSAETTDSEKCQLLMQQWRWQQINEWELKTRTRPASSVVVQETSTDGVSFSGKPVAYSS